MPYKFAIMIALATSTCAGLGFATAASAGDLGRDGYRNRTTTAAVRRSLLPATRLGSAYRGSNLAPRLGSRGSNGGSGWYQPRFGGTLNPGWGYNFGPNLGGLGR
jgi:hypothetical protein